MGILDAADRKILYAIYDDARKSAVWTAKRAGVSREVVRYRLSRLERAGVITGYKARVRTSHFCAGVATAFFKLVRSNESRYKEILAFLEGHSAINWVAELCGNADIVVTFLYKNALDLGEIVAETTQFMGENLKEHDLALYITEFKFTRKGLIHGKERRIDRSGEMDFAGGEPKEIDDIDRAIVDELAQDCRTSNRRLAALAGVGEDAVRVRIRRLERLGIIFGYIPILDINKMGLESYYVRLQLEHMDKATLGKARYYSLSNPYVVYAARCAGKYNLILSVEAKSRAHFNELLLDLRNRFGSQLGDYEFQLILKESKETFMPRGYLTGKGR